MVRSCKNAYPKEKEMNAIEQDIQKLVQKIRTLESENRMLRGLILKK